jgi:ADP-heptose:LPS heptosyltransferase
MINKGLSKFALLTLDRLTDVFPSLVPRLSHKLLLTIFGNRLLYAYTQNRYGRMFRQLSTPDKILVIGDVNIGDAILVQQSIGVLRYHYPNAQIDYLCNRIAGDLLSALPGADHVFRAFGRSGTPSRNDLMQIQDIVNSTRYSVIMNFCPFISKKELSSDAYVIHLYIPLTSYIIRSWKLRARPMHVSYAIQEVLREFLAPLPTPTTLRNFTRMPTPTAIPYEGNSIYLTHEAMERAKAFLAKHNLSEANRLLFFNPDAPSRYSQIPAELQIEILRQILDSEDINAVLLGTGHSTRGIERTLMTALPSESRGKVVLVPPLPLAAYAAIIDACDLFLSSDTGPVHIAASWKSSLSGDESLRNRTAVLTVFGASDSRIYAYDSSLSDHIPANQRAPSKVFVAKTPCRNVTCVNKLGKSCREVRCFDGMEAQEIVDYILWYFQELRRRKDLD